MRERKREICIMLLFHLEIDLSFLQIISLIASYKKKSNSQYRKKIKKKTKKIYSNYFLFISYKTEQNHFNIKKIEKREFYKVYFYFFRLFSDW